MPSTTFQPSLVNVLPQGVWHFREYLSEAEQLEVIEHVREMVRSAPLTTPRMPGGTEFKLRTTNAGEYGWMANGDGFFYAKKQATGCPWPAIPSQTMLIAQRAAKAAGFTGYAPNNCLVNYYEKGKGTLGLHRDDTRGEDFTQPIVTISLGESAVFGIGGNARTDKVTEIELCSGDVLVMGASGRMYFHRVTRILEGSSTLLHKGGRISLTFRRVTLQRPH